MHLGLYILASAMIFALAYVFTQFAKQGFMIAMLAASVMLDFYALVFMLIGMDRPVAILCTKFGCATITLALLFLSVKIPFSLFLAIKALKK